MQFQCPYEWQNLVVVAASHVLVLKLEQSKPNLIARPIRGLIAGDFVP